MVLLRPLFSYILASGFAYDRTNYLRSMRNVKIIIFYETQIMQQQMARNVCAYLLYDFIQDDFSFRTSLRPFFEPQLLPFRQ